MYRVIEAFADCADNLHIYQPGDSFPRAGLSVSEKRLKELAGNGNRIGKPVIVQIEEKPSRKRVQK